MEPEYINPTGEELYLMVTSRFANGSFPWSMVNTSGRQAWEAAASELLLDPSTITGKLIKRRRDEKTSV